MHYQTTYEITIEHADGRKYALRYSNRKSLRALRDNVRKMADHVLRVCGLDDSATMTECTTGGGLPRCRIGEWTVRYTGRTSIGSRGEPLPWIGRV